MTGISRQVGGLRKNPFRGGAMDNFWNHTMYFKSPRKVLLKPWLCEGSGGESCLKIKGGWAGGVKTSCTYLSLAKIMMKATKTMMTNICDVWFYRWFKYCFSFVLNSWSINTVFEKKEQKNNIQPKDKLETEHVQWRYLFQRKLMLFIKTCSNRSQLLVREISACLTQHFMCFGEFGEVWYRPSLCHTFSSSKPK